MGTVSLDLHLCNSINLRGATCDFLKQQEKMAHTYEYVPSVDALAHVSLYRHRSGQCKAVV